jgi:hypothetical protein
MLRFISVRPAGLMPQRSATRIMRSRCLASSLGFTADAAGPPAAPSPAGKKICHASFSLAMKSSTGLSAAAAAPPLMPAFLMRYLIVLPTAAVLRGGISSSCGDGARGPLPAAALLRLLVLLLCCVGAAAATWLLRWLRCTRPAACSRLAAPLLLPAASSRWCGCACVCGVSCRAAAAWFVSGGGGTLCAAGARIMHPCCAQAPSLRLPHTHPAVAGAAKDSCAASPALTCRRAPAVRRTSITAPLLHRLVQRVSPGSCCAVAAPAAPRGARDANPAAWLHRRLDPAALL